MNMPHCLAFTICTGAIVLGHGPMVSPPAAIANPTHSNHSSQQDGQGHDHGKLEVSAQQMQPRVDLVVHPDAIKGWNLELKVVNFNFAPDRVNTSSNPQEGHAHLYINGQKITRLYGPWYYLGDLEPGRHQITVTLNANGHEDLVLKGQAIADTETITVVGDRPD